MEWILEVVALTFLIGCVIGSFLNVVILRYEKKERVTGRSRCPSCGTQLTWFELIPVFSFLFLCGRCRRCSVSLSVQYPLVELVTGLLFVVVLYHNLPLRDLYAFCLFVLEIAVWALLFVIAVYDLRTKLIPNIFSYTFAGLAFLHMIVGSGSIMVPTLWHFLAGPLLFMPFYLLWKMSDGKWLGLGDGKLALGIGWFLGLSGGITAILLSFWIGAGVSLLLIGMLRIAQSKRTTLTLKSEIPFGPFMVFATLIVYFFEYDLFSYLL